MDERLRNEIVGYLEDHHVLTLGTAADNVPWTAAVFYASRDFAIYFFSDPKSRHCINIKQNPSVSAAIHQNYTDWREIRGLQIEGGVEELSAAELPPAMSAYVAKFPFVKDFLTPEGLFRIGGRMIGARFYKLAPSRVFLLDNSKGFRHREEFVIL